MNTSLSPHFGAVFRPTERWNLSATVHTPQKFQVDANFKFLVVTGETNGVDEGAGVSFTHDYLPWKISAGSSYDIVSTKERKVSVVGTALFAMWSDYVDRHSQRPAGPYAWYDTLSGSLGVRYQQGPLRALLDVGYEPSPVPDQTGRTNYVDNDRLARRFGLRLHFSILQRTIARRPSDASASISAAPHDQARRLLDGHDASRSRHRRGPRRCHRGHRSRHRDGSPPRGARRTANQQSGMARFLQRRVG